MKRCEQCAKVGYWADWSTKLGVQWFLCDACATKAMTQVLVKTTPILIHPKSCPHGPAGICPACVDGRKLPRNWIRYVVSEDDDEYTGPLVVRVAKDPNIKPKGLHKKAYQRSTAW